MSGNRKAEERIFDAFGLDEDSRQFIRNDLDGYRAARLDAEDQNAEFINYLSARYSMLADELTAWLRAAR